MIRSLESILPMKMRTFVPCYLAWCLVGCGASHTSVPTVSETPDMIEDSTENAPPPFSEEALREGVSLGERWTYLHEAGDESWLAHTEVVEHTDEGPTFMFWEEYEDGSPRSARLEAPATWADLVAHATYPLEDTTITAIEERVPAGTFTGWLYRVNRPDGGVVEAFFAEEFAGPPVRWERILDGETEHRMVLLERELPD